MVLSKIQLVFFFNKLLTSGFILVCRCRWSQDTNPNSGLIRVCDRDFYKGINFVENFVES